MARLEPLAALRYDLAVTGGLDRVVAPPYDVIDAEGRAALLARSPYNVVAVDLPEDPAGGDRYAHAAELLAAWERDGAVVRDEPALWVLEQAYTGPDGRPYVRRGFLGRIRIEEYGAGRVRPHERTHPGPKEDRLRLTRATRANLSPIFALYDDPGQAAWNAMAPHVQGAPWGEATDEDGTVSRVWRVDDAETVAAAQAALDGRELLIADGHHRYETARVYGEEIGGEGDHRYVLTCLVAFQDPGLTVFPTHRLVKGLRPDQHEALAATLREHFEIEETTLEGLDFAPGERLAIGYMDAHSKRPFMLTLKDPAIADRLLDGRAEPYRRLDTAVLEALILKGPVELTDERIDHLDGLGYARDTQHARELVLSGEYDAGFFMSGIPVERIAEVAAAGETMPPKSTYFFPKVPTGIVFSPLG